VRSEAFASAWLHREDFRGDGSRTEGALETLLAGALAEGSPAAAKSARVLGLTSLANLAGAVRGAQWFMQAFELHARAFELVLHDAPDT
jgi:hypothetical protein